MVNVFLLGQFDATDLQDLNSKVQSKFHLFEITDPGSLALQNGINFVVSKSLAVIQGLRIKGAYTIWLNSTSLPPMTPAVMAKLPKFSKPNKIITTLGQLEFLMQGCIPNNFDDLEKGEYFLMIYDFDHHSKFEKKKLQVQMFQHPKVVHFRVSPEIKQLVLASGIEPLI